MSLILEAQLSWHGSSTGPSKTVSSQLEPSSHPARSWPFYVIHVLEGSTPSPDQRPGRNPGGALSLSLHTSSNAKCQELLFLQHQALPGPPPTLSYYHEGGKRPLYSLPPPHPCSFHSSPLWPARAQLSMNLVLAGLCPVGLCYPQDKIPNPFFTSPR